MARRDTAALQTPANRWLLIALLLVIFPHLTRMPLWLAGLSLGIVGWRLAVIGHRSALPGRTLRLLLTAAAIAGVAFSYHTVSGRDAGVALLTLMLSLKVLELRSARDALVIVLLGYFLVVTGFLFDQSIFTGGYLVAVVVTLTATLIIIHHPGGGLERSRDYLKTAGQLTVQALPVAILLFVFFPRLPGPLWGLGTGETGRTGLSEEMTLGDISKLADSDAVAFRVQFEETMPAAGELYWRGPVLWHTDGRRWVRLDENARRRMPAPEYLPERASVRYTVTLEPHNRNWLFALDLPAQLPDGAAVTPGYQLLAHDLVDERRQYTIESYPHYRTQATPMVLLEAARQLPTTGNEATRQLASRLWAAAEEEPAAYVQAALEYLQQESFYYTREPPLLPEQDAIDDFLFTSQRGFCEHYAGAFAFLMRAGGLPARVVTGYQGGEVNAFERYLVVRQSDAHAWVEVWLNDRGWVRVDPTAVIPPDRVEQPTDAERFEAAQTFERSTRDRSWLIKGWSWMQHGWDLANYRWNQWVLGYDQSRQRQLMKQLGLDALGWHGLVAVMVGLLGLALGIVAVIVLGRRPRQRDPLVRLYRRFCRKAARIVPCRANEGPVDYADRLIAAAPERKREIEGIARLYTALRYGRAPNEHQLAELRRRVNAFRR